MWPLMRSPFKCLTLIALAGGLTVGVASPALAAGLASSDFVLIREGTTFDDDLYAAALTVRIEGRVNGDLIAVAAERVVISGTVTGSVTVFAPTVEVSGEVGGSVRAVANRVVITGTIGSDVVVSALRLDLTSSSEVSGEVVIWGNGTSSLGRIEEGLSGSLRLLDLAGDIGGSVVVSVGRLTIVDALTVGGGLAYRSSRDAGGLDMADVGGSITRRSPLPPNIRVRALVLFVKGMVALFLTVAAVATVWNWPERTGAAADRISDRPIRTWLSGAAVFATPAILLAATAGMLALAPPVASLPLLAVLVPLILTVSSVLLMVAIVAGIPSALVLGRRLFRKLGGQGAMLAGSVLLWVIWMLPWVGWLVPVIVLPMGLGGWMSTRNQAGQYPATADQVLVD